MLFFSTFVHETVPSRITTRHVKENTAEQVRFLGVSD